MKCSLLLCLAAAAVIAVAASSNGPAQEMQQGVSVQMAVTNNAKPMPEADTFGAWIVTVTDTGKLYFGVHAVGGDRLLDEMRSRPKNAEQKFYIKADARTPYANVRKVLDAGKEIGFESQVLLTSQPSPQSPGTVVAPKGLEVWTEGGADAIRIRVYRPTRQSPNVIIGNQKIPWTVMPRAVHELLRSHTNPAVQIEADGQLPFDDVVQVIDMCRGDGARVALVALQL